ncbi:hypothetical protein AMTR_s00041p00236010 [Amborella trichopoda]|uniref:BURP domain-containing protein n=1 Tax=Amborella trichopoda TaxID=13333 RepID=W1PZP5_AMBTC|nr:hypothetical protein AMTR_s00041p00236010 [Amborella trichopoda]
MERFPLACALLLIAGRVSHYCVLATPESYWTQVFPNNPLPDVIRSRLRPVPSGLMHIGSGNRDPRFLNNEFTKESRAKETTSFLEEELKVGMNKIFHLHKADFNNNSPFLPREDADAIPFSSAQLPRILRHFSIPPASSEAHEMHATLSWCESNKGKDKCLTSLEAMIDYVTPIFSRP